MKKSRLLSAVCSSVLTLVFTSANAAVAQPLQPRDLDGNIATIEAFYDMNLDITWAADANLNGIDTWNNQVAWVTGLTIGTVSGWRLPSADVDGDGSLVNCQGGGVSGCADNEMGYLYWEEGITAAAPGPFNNIQPNSYWTSTEINQTAAMVFSFGGGSQTFFDKSSLGFFAWPVHSGDVGAVIPVPAAVWLFGTGLIGLIGIARRKKV
jgi:hypothetical protein